MKLEKEQVKEIIPSIKRYVEEEFGEEIAPYAYNRGVQDAEDYFRAKLEDIQGSCHEYELTYWKNKR